MNRWSAAAALLLAFVAALALRLPKLDARPLHNDEAVNAIKVTELWEKGVYRYDPDEYHGPTLHYATLPFLWLSGARNAAELKDSTLRLAPVFFGAGLIFLLLLLKDALGRNEIIWSAFFVAVSPAMVFYSRYFIHEMLLIFFTALLIGACWRCTQNPRPGWAILAGASVGLMYATKETFVISIGALVVAAIATWWLTRSSEVTVNGLNPAHVRFNIRGIHIVVALAAFFFTWLILFSSFFTNWAGLADSVRTYLPWLKRAGGHSPHIHPWYFYFERLLWFHPPKSPVWNEGPLVTFALLGVYEAFRRKAPAPIFVAIYAIVLSIAYSAISYKTPWCLLNFLFPMILLAGLGATYMINCVTGRPGKVVMGLILAGSMGQMISQTYRGSFVYAADRRNPYVYAQTVPDLMNLVQKLDAIGKVASAGYESVVKVIAPDGDYWPLPWYLRRFKNVGWYEAMPADPFAPIIIVGATMEARLDEKSDKKWIMAGYTELRPQKFLELYVELELWKKYVATLPRDRD